MDGGNDAASESTVSDMPSLLSAKRLNRVNARVSERTCPVDFDLLSLIAIAPAHENRFQMENIAFGAREQVNCIIWESF